MSPEQARSKTVDNRTDIWAFGAVLFEMLTGQRAFKGADTTDTIVAVVSKEPDWSGLPPAIPSSIHRLLSRCLEKDPRRRLRHIADARFELDDASVDASASRVSTEAPVTATHLQLRPLTLVAGLVATIALGWWSGKALAPNGGSTIGGPQYLSVDLDEGVGFVQPALAVSPDGSRVVHSTAGGDTLADPGPLVLRTLTEQIHTTIPGTERATTPFFAPDVGWDSTGESLGVG